MTRYAATCLLLAVLAVTGPRAQATDPLQAAADELFQARTAVALLRTGDFQLRTELTVALDRAARDLAAFRTARADGHAALASDVTRVRASLAEVRRRAPEFFPDPA